MADQLQTSGQFIPLNRYNDISKVPSTYANNSQIGASGQYKGQSFYDVLNRTELTAAQLRSMQSPQNNGTSMLSTHKAPKPGNEETTGFVPAANSPYTQKMLKETEEHLKNIPAVIPQDEAFDNQIFQNMQEYAALKAEKASGTSSSPEPVAVLTQEQAPVSVQPAGNANSAPVTSSSSLHAILARNAVNPEDFKNEPVAPVFEPPKEIPKTALETAIEPALEAVPVLSEPISSETFVMPQSTSGFPSYIPAEQITSQIAANAALASQESKPIQAAQTQSPVLEPPKEVITEEAAPKSGKENSFFRAMSSFVGNIASAVTLGFYRPGGEPAPTGFARVIEPVKNVVWDAPKSLLVDAPVGAYNDITGGKKTENQTLASTKQNPRAVALNATGEPYRGVKNFGHSIRSIRRNFYT